MNIEEFESDDENFMQNAIGGFSSHKEIYDVALWMDEKRGLYIIPFLTTFFKCFESEIQTSKECVKSFLTSDKIPSSVIKYAHDKYQNFFKIVNQALNTNFETLEEVLFNIKAVFVDDGVYSPVSVLFNSELFSNLIGFKNKEEDKVLLKNIGRNDPCPCGSGLKYKNCCGKN